MKKFLLPESGKFYKANLHCHTNVSDAALSPEEIKKIYMEKGYSIVAYTDHNTLIPHPELAEENFLPLNGLEYDINSPEPKSYRTCHFCMIALSPDNIIQPCFHRTEYAWGNSVYYRDNVVKFDESLPDYVREYTPECISEMMKIGREKGFFVTYNHPTWSNEDYRHYMKYENMNAMEIYNHGCHILGHDEYNERVYKDMLSGGKRLFCIMTDDNHNHNPIGTRGFDSFGGFTMIKADKLEYLAITDALVKGNFYSSQGPEIHDLWVEDNKLHTTCSDADTIRLSAKTGNWIYFAENDKPLRSASFDLLPILEYVRITVIDKFGKRAETNAYPVEELLK